ncbi:MAG: thioredoxin [Candidatus Limimorpha sp.]
MKAKLITLLAFLFLAAGGLQAQTVNKLNYDRFIKEVWDFEKNPKELVYKGKLPCVIDFYADWCGPCRRVAPIMEKLAKDYEGKIIIYKVNVDQEKQLAATFEAKSIPMVLFFPKKGQPLMQVGALTETQFKEIIDKNLLQ